MRPRPSPPPIRRSLWPTAWHRCAPWRAFAKSHYGALPLVSMAVPNLPDALPPPECLMCRSRSAFDPFGVAVQAPLDRCRGDFRTVPRVQFGDTRREPITDGSSGTERHPPFFAFAQFAEMPEHGRGRSGDLGSGRQSLADNNTRDRSCVILGRRRRGHRPHSHRCHTATLCVHRSRGIRLLLDARGDMRSRRRPVRSAVFEPTAPARGNYLCRPWRRGTMRRSSFMVLSVRV